MVPGKVCIHIYKEGTPGLSLFSGSMENPACFSRASLPGWNSVRTREHKHNGAGSF